MIDVLNQLKSVLVFNDNDDFYLLQILQRKKENPNLGSNSRVIKNYYIGSIEYLESKYEEIKMLCIQFNARAMIRLNKRSYKKVAFKTLQNIANSMSNDDYSFIKNSYDRACGNGHNDKIKKWILDIDYPYTKEYLNEVRGVIKNTKPVGDKILLELPTKNGIHFITTPFDLREFKTDFPDIEIHKDNPVNLFIP